MSGLQISTVSTTEEIQANIQNFADEFASTKSYFKFLEHAETNKFQSEKLSELAHKWNSGFKYTLKNKMMQMSTGNGTIKNRRLLGRVF